MRPSGTLTLRRGDGRIICESVKVADTYARRMKGLLGRRRLNGSEGLVLRPSWSLHTWFMRFPIDVVFLDHDQVVIRIDEAVGPFKTATCRAAREVIELPAGECARRELQVGDRVSWAPRAVRDDFSSISPPVAAQLADGTVLVASTDRRFAKLAEFLLVGRGIAVTAVVPPATVSHVLEEHEPDVVVLDAGNEIAGALRMAQFVRARRPETAVVMVGDDKAAARAPESAKMLDKWQQTDDVVAAVASALQGQPA